MSFTPATPKQLRPNEKLLSAREFFTLRAALDAYHESFFNGNLPHFPSFAARFSVNGGTFVIRGSLAGQNPKAADLSDDRDLFYADPSSPIERRISGFVNPSFPFGKMSATLFLDFLSDEAVFNLASKLFPNKDLKNPILGGLSVSPHPDLNMMFTRASGLHENLALLMNLDEVRHLATLFAALEVATNIGSFSEGLTLPSGPTGSPVSQDAGSIVSAISGYFDLMREKVPFFVCESLLCDK
jgi:hypothetical protein